MSQSFKNRVFGCVIIKANNANYNADFTGQPRTLPDGTVYATDKALKYTVRNYWKEIYPQENLFFFKSFDETLKPRTLDERYVSLFGDFKRNVTSDKYCLFKYDGETVVGLIPNQPKKKNVTDIYKDIDEDDELLTIKDQMVNLSSKKVQVSTPENITKDNFGDESFIFFLNKDGAATKIESDDSTISKAVKLILENMGGGINRILTLKDLLTCIDIKTFGATYAGEINLSLHGTTQFTHGVNRFKESVIYSEQISSPFRNSNEKSTDAMQTTLGSQFKLQEGHYVHHLSVNPRNLEEMAEAAGSEGLLDTDIDKLKEALKNGATFYDSAAKAGVENEVLFWVQLKPESKQVLPSFVELISVHKTDNNGREIDFSKVKELLEKESIKNQIEKIEVFYNSGLVTLKNLPVGTIEGSLN